MASFAAAVATAQTSSSPPHTDPPPVADVRFTIERLDHWLTAGRVQPPVATPSEATVKYVIERGTNDPRLLYPTRIAQQLSASLADWEALTDDVQRSAHQFGRRFLVTSQLNQKASSLHTWTLVDPPAVAVVDAFLRRRPEVYGLVTAAARGDRDAANRYAGLATDMAADPFIREVFAGATFARSVESDLNAISADEALDQVVRWRAYALNQMLHAGSAERARAAFASVAANTAGPVAEDEQIRPRQRADASSEQREPRTRIVQDCSWESGYEFVPGEGEAQRVEKYVCRDREIEE